MNSSEQESFEGQSQIDSPDNMAAGGGNTGTPEASNDGGAGQTSAVTPDMLLMMMQRMQEQTAVLQQHIMNASGSQSTGKFSLESESFNPTWSYRLKWDATKQSLKEWWKEFLTEVKTVRPAKMLADPAVPRPLDEKKFVHYRSAPHLAPQLSRRFAPV